MSGHYCHKRGSHGSPVRPQLKGDCVMISCSELEERAKSGDRSRWYLFTVTVNETKRCCSDLEAFCQKMLRFLPFVGVDDACVYLLSKGDSLAWLWDAIGCELTCDRYVELRSNAAYQEDRLAKLKRMVEELKKSLLAGGYSKEEVENLIK